MVLSSMIWTPINCEAWEQI